MVTSYRLVMTKTRETRYRIGGALAFGAAAVLFAVGSLAPSPALLLAGAGNLLLGTVLLRKLGLFREPRPQWARATRAEPRRE